MGPVRQRLHFIHHPAGRLGSCSGCPRPAQSSQCVCHAGSGYSRKYPRGHVFVVDRLSDCKTMACYTTGKTRTAACRWLVAPVRQPNTAAVVAACSRGSVMCGGRLAADKCLAQPDYDRCRKSGAICSNFAFIKLADHLPHGSWGLLSGLLPPGCLLYP